MKINTKYLGEINIDEENILTFPDGLLGFENHREFVLLEVPDNPYFKFLQDIKNDYISFLLVNPWDFFEGYDVELADEGLLKIGLAPDGKNQMAVFSIVTIGGDFKKSTSNLLAPIVINLQNKKGKQFVLSDTKYTTKHMLFPEGKVD